MLHIKTTKILLLCMSLCTGHSFALHSLDDEFMGNITGQDGITVQLYTDRLSVDKALWHDNDGLQPTANESHGITTPEAAALVVNDLVLTPQHNTMPLLDVHLDVDGGGAQAAMLNIGVDIAAMDISVGSIAVGKSNAQIDLHNPSSGARRSVQSETKIIEGFTLSLGKMNFNIQLGREAQGHLLTVHGTMQDGINISNLGVLADGNTQYAFSIGEMKVTDSKSKDLTFRGTGVDISNSAGLIITPSARTLDVSMEQFVLGGTTTGGGQAIGAMKISGLDLGNKIIIQGH